MAPTAIGRVPELNPREALALGLIIGCIDRFGWPPTKPELSMLMDRSGNHAAESVLSQLERKGYVSIEPHTQRGIRVLRFLNGEPACVRVVPA